MAATSMVIKKWESCNNAGIGNGYSRRYCDAARIVAASGTFDFSCVLLISFIDYEWQLIFDKVLVAFAVSGLAISVLGNEAASAFGARSFCFSGGAVMVVDCVGRQRHGRRRRQVCYGRRMLVNGVAIVFDVADGFLQAALIKCCCFWVLRGAKITSLGLLKIVADCLFLCERQLLHWYWQVF